MNAFGNCSLARAQHCLSRLFQLYCKWKITNKKSRRSIFFSTFPASFIVFLLFVLHACTLVKGIVCLCMCWRGEGNGGSTKGMRNSVQPVKKPTQVLLQNLFRLWQRCNEFSTPTSQLVSQLAIKNKEALLNIKWLSEDGGGGGYQMRPLLAWSISLDSTFKYVTHKEAWTIRKIFESLYITVNDNDC